MTREFHDIHREEVRGDALYKRYEDEEAKQSRKRREGDILYDAQKMIPSSSESDDDWEMVYSDKYTKYLTE